MATTDRLKRMVLETCSTTGTGVKTLGGAVGSYLNFVTGFGGTGGVVWYHMRNAANTKWEEGYATLGGTGPYTLTCTPLASSTGGAAINWQAGDAPYYVYCPDGATIMNSMLRLHWAGARPAWLPSMSLWMKDLGSSLAQLMLYDGSADIGGPIFNTSTDALQLPEIVQDTFSFRRLDAAGFGPTMYFYHDSASPLATDVSMGIVARGRDSAANVQDYGSINHILDVVTSASEESHWEIYYSLAGASVLFGKIGKGLSIGAPTGGLKGSGSLNVADAIYANDNLVIASTGIHRHVSFTVGTLPSASPAGQEAYCSNETGGAVLVFSDGSNWRRVTDRAIAA